MPAASNHSSVPDPATLRAAVRGDDEAFRRLVCPHQAALHAHCYRMLGSVHDADDLLQEVLLRVWRALPRFEPGRPLRPWLHTIATNACLNAIARRPLRRLPEGAGPPAGSGAGTGGDGGDGEAPLPRSVWLSRTRTSGGTWPLR